MRLKRWYGIGAGLFLLALLLAPAPALQAQEKTPPPSQEIGPNLLINPGFEGMDKPMDNPAPNPGNWTRDTFNGAQYGEIFTPEGWAAWWEEGEYGRPECKVIPNEPPFNIDPVRIYQGYYSALCFGFYRIPHAGFYQVVRNIPPASIVEAAVMAHAWSCGEDNPPLSCGDFTAFYFRVGIDPDGDTDPFSENIVWSERYYNFDKFARVGPVQATVGITGVATLFLEATAKWPNKHNDAYWDNARLNIVVTGTLPTATPPPPPPPSGPIQPTATPQFTPTPLPEGSIIHTVEEGETWLGISLLYGVEPFDLLRLNAGRGNESLAVGREVVVRIGPREGLAMAEVATALPGLPDASVQPNLPAGDKGTICVLAFNDANGDMFRQGADDEMALPDADIALVDADGSLITSYRTDGSEPYCFQDLPIGQQYIVRHTPPPGYNATVGPWQLRLSGGQVYHVELACTRDPSAAPGVMPGLNLSLRIVGGGILLLAVVSAVYFILSRRV